ncbi:MAG TPA: SRPBCC family protein [Cellulomonas sp.]
MITRGRDRHPTARSVRLLPLDAGRAWPLVADARHHGRWVPLTRVALDGRDGPVPTDRPPRVGDVVRAVSGPGARHGGPGLVDRLRVERYEPPLGSVPGVAVFVRLGPVLLGSAQIEVEQAGPDASRVTWSESAHLRGLPRGATAGLGALLVDVMLALTMPRVVREAGSLARCTQRIAGISPIHATNSGGTRNITD